MTDDPSMLIQVQGLAYVGGEFKKVEAQRTRVCKGHYQALNVLLICRRYKTCTLGCYMALQRRKGALPLKHGPSCRSHMKASSPAVFAQV
jgi:hypothetical protein